MPVDKRCYIHSRGGRLGVEGVTTVAEVDDIAAALEAAPTPRHLVLHFHGGLVTKEAGFQIAQHLLQHAYRPPGSPVLYIWESGAWETIRNNFTELADEPVFKNVLRKVMEYALKRLGANLGTRSVRPGEMSRGDVTKALETFIAHPSRDTIPYRDFEPYVGEAEARAPSMLQIDEAEIRADLENDEEFKRALASLPDIPPARRSTLLRAADAVPVVRTPFSEHASEVFSEEPGRRGLISLFKAAAFLVKVLKAVLVRYRDKRDHGFYATCVEEAVRQFKVAGSSANEWGKALQWNRMKQDCVDAFKADSNVYAGTAFIHRVHKAIERNVAIDRVTLVAHSAGAVYLCEWIEAAHKVFPGAMKFNVILLAPAVTYARFATMLDVAGRARIANFRMFAMSDALERDDQVWGDDHKVEKDWRRFIYPSSLLYLVSGILESKENAEGTLVDEADIPLLGMERFYLNPPYNSFPEVAAVKAWLRESPDCLVWSATNESAGDGLRSHCRDHGAFDNEPVTVISLQHLVANGF